jgi:hypothetical protein
MTPKEKVMSLLANEYRAKALEVSVMELETDNTFMRQTYAKLYKHWLELAERVEREEAATFLWNTRGANVGITMGGLATEPRPWPQGPEL